MWLNFIWYVLFVIIIAGYLILDGFDLGVGILHLALAKNDVTVMHPGPINRGVEMDSVVADGPHSVILEQVTHGIAVRMAVMSMAMRQKGQNTEASA